MIFLETNARKREKGKVLDLKNSNYHYNRDCFFSCSEN